MKKKLLVVGCLLALLACAIIPVASSSRGLFPLDPPPHETQIYYGTAEDPLGWGTWVTPDYPPYDYILVEADLTSLKTGKREVRCTPCVPCRVNKNDTRFLHQEDPPPERPNAFYVAVLTDDLPTVHWGHLPDGYYTGWLQITWVRE